MNGSHLDDESLSAALDGVDPVADAHVAGCPTCQARSAALGRAGRAVGALPPAGAPAGLVDRAVGAALAAYAAEREAAPRSASPPSRADASADDGDEGDDHTVVPLRVGPPGSADRLASPRAPTSGADRRRMPAWALGVAAAVAAIAVAVPVLTRDTHDDRVSQSAGPVRADKSDGASSAGVVADGGDLGDQSDQLALGQILSGAVAGTPRAAAAEPQAIDSGRSDFSLQPSAGAATTAPAVSELRTTPDQARPAPSGPTSTAAASSVSACEDAVRSDFAKGLGPLLYRATLRWQGTPAVLLAYRLADTTGSGPDRRAFVMALDGCQLLVVQGF